MKDIKLLISSILIIIAFFIWILFWKQINQDKIDLINAEAKYVNIDINKSKIDIQNSSKNVYITINWKAIDEAELSLEKICK